MGYNPHINGVYWGYNPLILTIDPNFQRDIQVEIPTHLRVPREHLWERGIPTLHNTNEYISQRNGNGTSSTQQCFGKGILLVPRRVSFW